MTSKYYLYNPKTDQKYPINGLISSQEPVNAIPMDELVSTEGINLPRAVDLRTFMSDVERQFGTNSCVANSIVGAYEYLMRRHDGDERDMSRFFIYYNARAMDPARASLIRDTGCTINHAIEAIKRLGTCTENRWKFNNDNRNRRPTDDCYAEARNYTATDAVSIPVDLISMKTCLARGYPFVFGASLYTSFKQAETNGGMVPYPKAGEMPLRNSEKHAMLAVGYDDERQYFIVRNSWGRDWGNQGYCAMPYQYLTNPNLCEQVYTIRKLTTFDLGTDHWREPSQIQYGIPNDLGAGEDDNDEDCQVIKADDDEDEDEAGAANNDNWQNKPNDENYDEGNYGSDEFEEE